MKPTIFALSLCLMACVSQPENLPPVPTAQPTEQPTSQPTIQPTAQPTPASSAIPPAPQPSPQPEASAAIVPALQVPVYTGECALTNDETLTLTSMTGRVLESPQQPAAGVVIRVRNLEPCATATYQETLSDAEGNYVIDGLPAGALLEIEVAPARRKSAFFQTRLSTNKQAVPEVNYFPFQIKTLPETMCTGAYERIQGTGHISLAQTALPADAEGLVRLRSLNVCDGFSTETLTRQQAFSLSFLSLEPTGQITLSFAGHPTLVDTVRMASSQASNAAEANALSFALSDAVAPWPELPSQWTPGRYYLVD